MTRPWVLGDLESLVRGSVPSDLEDGPPSTGDLPNFEFRLSVRRPQPLIKTVTV